MMGSKVKESELAYTSLSPDPANFVQGKLRMVLDAALVSVGSLERHLTLAGSSKMAETMYTQLLRFSEQANFVTADRKILDAKIYQFTN